MKQQTELLSQKTTYGRIEDIFIDEDGTTYVKVLMSNGQLIGGNNVAGLEDDPPRLNTSQADYKLLKYSENSPAFVQAKDDSVYLAGSEKNRFVSTKEFGNFIAGPTTFMEHPQNIRIGAAYRFNGQLTSTIPSTIMTPVPTLILDIPGEGILKMFSKILNDFTQLLGV